MTRSKQSNNKKPIRGSNDEEKNFLRVVADQTRDFVKQGVNSLIHEVIRAKWREFGKAAPSDNIIPHEPLEMNNEKPSTKIGDEFGKAAPSDNIIPHEPLEMNNEEPSTKIGDEARTAAQSDNNSPHEPLEMNNEEPSTKIGDEARTAAQSDNNSPHDVYDDDDYNIDSRWEPH